MTLAVRRERDVDGPAGPSVQPSRRRRRRTPPGAGRMSTRRCASGEWRARSRSGWRCGSPGSRSRAGGRRRPRPRTRWCGRCIPVAMVLLSGQPRRVRAFGVPLNRRRLRVATSNTTIRCRRDRGLAVADRHRARPPLPRSPPPDPTRRSRAPGVIDGASRSAGRSRHARRAQHVKRPRLRPHAASQRFRRSRGRRREPQAPPGGLLRHRTNRS